MGGYIIFQSAIHQQWLGVALGGYFASMGLFALGVRQETALIR
jgi:hypothetical protein